MSVREHLPGRVVRLVCWLLGHALWRGPDGGLECRHCREVVR